MPSYDGFSSVKALLGVPAIAVALVLAIAPVTALAADTPTLGGGDCWRAGTPFTCRNTWAGANTWIYFRAIDQFSGSYPGWKTYAQTAVNNWNSAPGPQFYSFTAHSNDTWIYMTNSVSGQHDLTDQTYGITWNCDTSSVCRDTNTAADIMWTDIYLNGPILDFANGTIKTETFAHESGHGMGLAHNTTVSNALMWPSTNNQTVPQGVDIGQLPGCSGAGVRCVYEDLSLN